MKIHDSEVYKNSECLESGQCHTCGQKLLWKQDVPPRLYNAYCGFCEIMYTAFVSKVVVRSSDGG